MSARTILAVRTGRTKFKGVFHEEGNEPWILGDHLLSRVIRARGDLEKVVQDVVHAAPWGWVNLQREEQSTLKKIPNRRLFSQNILRKRDEVEMDWVYLFDLDARTLTISAAEDVDRSGVAPAPYVVVTFSDRGRPAPRQIVPPPPPWPEHPVAEAWEGDLPDLKPLRQRALAVTDAWCDSVGLPPENLSMLVGAAMSAVFAKAVGAELEALYVPAPHGEEHAYWAVELYDTTLYYPSPAWRDTLRANEAMYAADTVEVWGQPNRTATVNLSPKHLLAGYDDLPWSDALPEQEATLAAVLRGIAAGLFPRSDIDSDGLRVFRWMKVVEVVSDPDREVRVTAQNEQEIGNEVQNTFLLKWAWDILDWLRASQVEDADAWADEGEPEAGGDEGEPEADDDEEPVDDIEVVLDEDVPDDDDDEYVEEDEEEVEYDDDYDFSEEEEALDDDEDWD